MRAEHLQLRLDDEIKHLEEFILSGNAPDWVGYRERIGKLNGLKRAKALLAEVEGQRQSPLPGPVMGQTKGQVNNGANA